MLVKDNRRLALSPGAPLWALVLLSLLLPLPPGAARADDEPAAGSDAPAADEDLPHSALLFTATAPMQRRGSRGQEDFRFDLDVRNKGEVPVVIHSANLLLAHLGGWLVPRDPDTLDGSFFRGPLEVKAGETQTVAGSLYRAITPATHALLALQAEDGHAEVSVPITLEGFAVPRPYSPPYPFGVGLVGPLHVLPFSDGENAVLLIGQHQVLSGGEITDVETSVQIGNDSGSTEAVTWKGLGAEGDRVLLWPFVRRVAVFDGFDKGVLRITSSARVKGIKRRFSGTWPVVRVDPWAVRAPVLGAWQLSNGPGRAEFASRDALPQDRYAYDMVVLEKGRTHRGEPNRNESYFAWNRTVRAVADGVVVDVCDRERDNPGYRGALTDCFNNRVVLRHADGTYTAYTHLRRHSVTQGLIPKKQVRAGQVMGRVGNSGNSSEPHLHFLAFRVDDTGRIRGVPVRFVNAYRDAKGTQPVAGIALSGNVYHFR